MVASMKWLKQFWWWFTPITWDRTLEERTVAVRFLVITGFVFLVLSIVENWLFGKLGIERHVAAWLAFFTAMLVGLVVARNLGRRYGLSW